MSGDAWIIIYGLLSFYCLAGCLMEHFAVMQGWLFVGDAEFTKVHIAQSNGITYIYVVPKLLLTLLIVTLLFIRPATVAMLLIWISLLLLAISWGSSFLIQIPIQQKIRQHKSVALVRRLIQTNWIRVGAMIAHNVVVCFVLAYALH